MSEDQKPQTMEDMLSASGGHTWEQGSEQKRVITLRDLPFMQDVDGNVVCFPQSVDEPTICIIGKKGKGKSYLMHAIADRAFWYWRKSVYMGNDSTHETLSWGYPNKTGKQVRALRRTLHEEPRGLPMVHYLPSVEGKQADFEHLTISIPFHAFLHGIERFFDLGKTALYFRNLREDFLNCQSYEELVRVVDDHEKELHPGSVAKIKSFLYDLSQMEIVDAFNRESISQLRVRVQQDPMHATHGKLYDPISGIIRTGAVVSFHTRDLIGRKGKHNIDYADSFISYYLDTLYENQKSHPWFSANKISLWIFMDELTQLSTATTKTQTHQSIRQLVAQGRPNRIGTVFATQNFSLLDHVTRSNTQYVITLQQNSSEEVNPLARCFDLTEEEQYTIRTLEKFEVLAMTDEHFIVYTPDGRTYKTQGPLRGNSLPPLSRHEKPKESSTPEEAIEGVAA